LFNSYVDSDFAKKYRIITGLDSVPISFSLSCGEKIERSRSILQRKLRQAMEGSVESAIHIYSGDCGTRKSTTAQDAIADWKGSGFPGRAGIIVAVNTLAEIDTYIGGSKLDLDDYAVVCADAAYNRYGLGRSRADEAKVLFTTHEQYRNRVIESGGATKAEAFFYAGKPRVAVIWDEGLLVAPFASFELNELRAIPSAFRARPREEQTEFEALLPDQSDLVSGGSIGIPIETGKLAKEFAIQRKGKLIEPVRQTLDGLGKLGGATAYLRGGEDEGWRLIGRGVPLPNDGMPMFVLDASARLTGNYDHLDRYGFRVVHMEPALVSYANLRLLWWNKGAGKSALSSSGKDRGSIIATIAALINSKPREEWLIVHRKSFGRELAAGDIELPDDLTSKLDNPALVSSVTWGRHLGTNAFRHVPNVIVLGSYNYNDGAYEAMHLAVSGAENGDVSEAERRAREDAEFAHNVYQAICRSRVRCEVNGVCAPAVAYLIMARTERRQRMIEKAFPDCVVEEWQPGEPKPASKFQHITSTLLRLLEDRAKLTKKELIAECGSSDRSYIDKIKRSDGFKKFLVENGITFGDSTFSRIASALVAA
jgi:hypothetical protein